MQTDDFGMASTHLPAHTPTAEEAIALEARYGARNYDPLPVVLSRGLGVYVWDTAGKRYTDMMSAYSAVSHGHCHPRLVQCLTAQAQRLTVCSRAFYNDRLGVFLKRICELTHMDRALPMNTGVEAVETAIKAARKWAYTVKRVPKDCAEIIVCHGNFHGRTTTVVGMSSNTKYQFGFGPFAPGFKWVPYADLTALERAISPNTAAFLVEPMQGERGIIVPPAGYLRQAAELCRKHNVLLIADEVQTGLGRTGRFLACDHEQVQPDGLILGKALGGGLLPVSLFLSQREVMDVFTPGDHGSTFGGNPLAATVALEALEVLFDEGLIQNAERLGDYFHQALLTLDTPLVKEIRGKGLFLGMEIDARYANGRAVCLQLLERGVLTYETHDTVIRLTPPLVVNQTQVDKVFSVVQEVVATWKY